MLYTADTAGGKSITGLQFQPDFTWIKNRNNIESHYVFDVVRGTGGAGTSKALSTNATVAEYAVDAGITFAFLSNGYQITDTNYNAGELYFNSRTYASWNWKAGGAAVTNTAGSISTQVSANVSAGFSIIKYVGNGTAGATIGHGLGAVPDMFVVKRLDTGNWPLYHSGNATPARDIFYLNLTSAVAVNTTFWNNVLPTSSVITLGNTGATNASGINLIAYCWTAVKGYSAFGKYTGNGNADGPFVYTGFKPRWIMIKYATGVSNWLVLDTSRDTYNVTDAMLEPNLSDAEATGAAGSNNWDVLSNGFKIRGNGALTNASGGLFVYAAFAENPFKNALAR